MRVQTGWRRVGLALTAWVALTVPSTGEEFTAKSGTAAAPRRLAVPMAMRIQPPGDPQAERDSREARLRQHHLPGPLEIVPPGPLAAMAPSVAATSVTAPGGSSPIELRRNDAMPDSATNDVTSLVNEPSLAVKGQEILYTGNWYAAFSVNGGATFQYVNPETTFPAIPNQPFCCDQVALYDAAHDVMIWYLQYVNDSNGNTMRIAVAHGADIASQQWRYYDFTPQGVGGWSGEWFDFPDMAVGAQHLYVTTNLFSTTNDRFTRALILRLPLDKLAAYQSLTYSYFDSASDFSLRPTQGATDTMYFGGHVATNRLRVFTWPEAGTTLSSAEVGVSTWSDAPRVAPGPDGRDWLGRADGRITAAWLSGDRIGFAWTAAQDGGFPFPQVRVALVNRTTMARVAEPHVWNADHAFAYPAAAPNADGVVGISLHYGGGARLHPSHAVGTLDGATLAWTLLGTSTGTHGPSSNRWGDYLAVRPHGADRTTWAATGFTLEGGTQARNVVPRYVHFAVGGGPTPAKTVTLTNLDPDKVLEKGDTLRMRAEVREGGNPVSGQNVTFSADASLVTVSPASGSTDADGILEATVRGEASWTSTTTNVTAQADGISASAPVKVPDLSPWTAIAVALLLLFLGWRRRARVGPW